MRSAAAMAILFASYTLGFYGYILIKGYNLSIAQVMKPVPATGSWPPAFAADTMVFPDGKPWVVGGGADFGPGSSGGSSSSSGSSGATNNPANGPAPGSAADRAR